jgi:choline dehydrogenase-like flavoprotein
MLGGSSGINFLAYARPCAEDIDDWSEALGIRGWSWSELLPYFKLSERLEFEESNIINRDTQICPLHLDSHGLTGAIHTSMGTWQTPFEKDLIKAFDEVSGLSRPQDPYNGSHLGFYRTVSTTDRTEKPIRSYSASGYLAASTGRANLTVLTNALARKILIERDANTSLFAKGVEFQHGGLVYSALAKKEVILSAGAIQSPQLLELSGIGDPHVLEGVGIRCLVPNPHVGNNLQEHTMSAVVYELAPNLLSLDSLFLDPALLVEHQNLYTESHSGAYSGVVSLTGYISYSSQVDRPDFEQTVSSILSKSHIITRSPSQDPTFQERQQEAIVARMRKSTAADILLFCSPANFDIKRGYSDCSKLMPGPPNDHNACYSITVSNMYPISRGSVHIQSINALDPPRIDPGFHSHPADADILAVGVSFADKVFQSPLLKDKIARRVDPVAEVNLGNPNEAREYVRDRIVTYHHMLGTCAMGQVVDERLRVKGVDRLRVVDASICPMQISAATMGTVYAIAEKAATLIKEDLKSDG